MAKRMSLKSKPVVEKATLTFTDDECVQKLAMLIEHKDNKNLREIAALISRLAVPIE